MRTHYFYRRNPALQELQERGALIDVSSYPVVEELCLAADALITDYSSIMFDYANLDRPIISYADDWDTYVHSRGVTFNLLSGEPGDTPGVIATTEDELIDAFRSGRWDDERATELRAAFRARFCQWDDGNAAERVVRQVFLGAASVPEPLPYAERTVAPSPRAAATMDLSDWLGTFSDLDGDRRGRAHPWTPVQHRHTRATVSRLRRSRTHRPPCPGTRSSDLVQLPDQQGS
ncbi:CoA-transferase family protein [Streptomyces sp. NBRC 110611]|nr:CoA-transferase family protein [Streptomyces sp. NBRC 110611]